MEESNDIGEKPKQTAQNSEHNTTIRERNVMLGNEFVRVMQGTTAIGEAPIIDLLFYHHAIAKEKFILGIRKNPNIDSCEGKLDGMVVCTFLCGVVDNFYRTILPLWVLFPLWYFGCKSSVRNFVLTNYIEWEKRILAHADFW